MKEKHIYIIGSKGIPAKYGGFETFVEELTTHQSNKKLKYIGVFSYSMNHMISFKNIRLTQIKK